MLTQKLLFLSLMGTEWVINLLLILSIFSIAIIIERAFVLKKKKGNLQDLYSKLTQAFKDGSIPKVEKILADDDSSAAKIAFSIIQTTKETKLDMEDAMAIAISQEKVNLDSRLSILGTLGSNAPFIGLFGTVLGIIHAFHNLAQNTTGGPGVVMGGISEALVATALGLFVAIPAVAAYNYFVRYVKKIIVASENLARFVVVSYAHEKGKVKH